MGALEFSDLIPLARKGTRPAQSSETEGRRGPLIHRPLDESRPRSDPPKEGVGHEASFVEGGGDGRRGATSRGGGFVGCELCGL